MTLFIIILFAVFESVKQFVYFFFLSDAKTSKPSVSTAKGGLDKISEGTESLTSKSEATYKERVKSLHELTSESLSLSKDIEEKSEDIQEDVSTAVSDDKSEEMLMVDLKSKQDLYDVSVQDELTYEDDFTCGPTGSLHDKLNKSGRSVSIVESAPLSARSVTENIVSVAADDSSYSRQFDLKGRLETEELDRSEQESDLDISRSSRPSSGKSERSSVSTTEHESSESEKSPKVLEQVDTVDYALQPTKPANLFQENVLDIDDLLGPPEEITPLPSEQSSPSETPRQKSEASTASNFFEPLADFNIGERISVTGPSGDRVNGTLKFRGNVKFAPGVWAGVELDKPEGRHNGLEDGERYFTCKDKHGLIVPGHDVRAVEEEEEEEIVEVRDSFTAEDTDLMKVITQAAKDYESFGSPRVEEEDRNILADRITDELFESVIKQDLSTISNIANKQADRKKGPPVAPKPSKKAVEVQEEDTEEQLAIQQPATQQPARQTLEEEPPIFRDDHRVNERTDSTVANLMNAEIEHMIKIRQSRQAKIKDEIEKDEEIEEEGIESPASPTEEIAEVIDKPEEESDLNDLPLRPGSPIPGLQSSQVSSS